MCFRGRLAASKQAVLECALLYSEEGGGFLVLDLDPGPPPARPVGASNRFDTIARNPSLRHADYGRAIDGDMLA
jgi:hypothetical protein